MSNPLALDSPAFVIKVLSQEARTLVTLPSRDSAPVLSMCPYIQYTGSSICVLASSVLPQCPAPLNLPH